MMHQDEKSYEVKRYERRQEDSLLLHIQELQASAKALDVKVTHYNAILEQHIEDAMSKVIERSFPAGDSDGHRRYHELVIQREEAKAKFWQELFTNTAKWAGIGLLAFVVHAAWSAFLKGPNG